MIYPHLGPTAKEVPGRINCDWSPTEVISSILKPQEYGASQEIRCEQCQKKK